MPSFRQIRADRWVKAMLVLAGIALLLPGIYALLVVVAMLLAVDGPPPPAAMLAFLGALAFLTLGIWLIHYAVKNR